MSCVRISNSKEAFPPGDLKKRVEGAVTLIQRDARWRGPLSMSNGLRQRTQPAHSDPAEKSRCSSSEPAEKSRCSSSEPAEKSRCSSTEPAEKSRCSSRGMNPEIYFLPSLWSAAGAPHWTNPTGNPRPRSHG